MTEDEAKKKVPVARASIYAGNGAIAHRWRVDSDTRCIGSACMMWQWRKRPPE
jgi:hypothetical protein